jgi:hypothetical protein
MHRPKAPRAVVVANRTAAAPLPKSKALGCLTLRSCPMCGPALGPDLDLCSAPIRRPAQQGTGHDRTQCARQAAETRIRRRRRTGPGGRRSFADRHSTGSKRGDQFADHGGRVLSAARVYPIYWGRYWPLTGSHRRHRTRSPRPSDGPRRVLPGRASQYRDIIGPAVLHGSHVITTSDPRSQFANRDIEAFLDAQFGRRSSPRFGRAGGVCGRSRLIYSGEATSFPASTATTGVTGTGFTTPGSPTRGLDGATRTTTHEIVESSPILRAARSRHPRNLR